MSITVKVRRIEEVPVKYLRARCGVRHWEDATVNGVEDTDGTLIPCRRGDLWEPLIELESGRIANWPHGTVARIHYKVCDCGTYSLVGDNNAVVAEKEGYVPHIMCPKGPGYGDYVIMDVDADGKIAGWKANLDDFETEEED